MRKILFLTALTLSSSAFAADPSTSTPAANPAAPVGLTATGSVKAIDLAKHTITVTVGKKDVTYATPNLSLDATVKVGAKVDVTYNNLATGGVSTATAVVLHK